MLRSGAAELPPRAKITFVAEQFVPPVRDGSTYVYKNWIDFLARRFELYAIFFRTYPGEDAEAHEYLRERCKAHLILPGTPRLRSWKVARAGFRFATGKVFAPRWLEEIGRTKIHAAIDEFCTRYDLSTFLISKLVSVPLFGEVNFRRPGATFFLDMHDDFVLRDAKERSVLRALCRKIPALASYPPFRDIRVRQILSRLSVAQARAQEARMCGLFDAVLLSSPEDLAAYRSLLDVPCECIGWPPQSGDAEGSAADFVGPPCFDAGFIGGNHPFNVEGLLHFCTDILPRIREVRPEFKFLVAGKVAMPLLHARQSWPGVDFIGYVPEVRWFYEQVRVSVVPILSGTGVSLKTIEALEYGRPVISTPTGARGLPSRSISSGLTIAEGPEDFATKLLAQLSAPPVKAQTGRQQSLEAGFEAAFSRLLLAYPSQGQQRGPTVAKEAFAAAAAEGR